MFKIGCLIRIKYLDKYMNGKIGMVTGFDGKFYKVALAEDTLTLWPHEMEKINAN